MTEKKVAAVQWAPEILSPKLGIEKAVTAVEMASKDGAQLIVFPECWLQGYPYWSGLAPSSEEYQVFRQLNFESAITITDPLLKPIYKAAQTHKCCIVLGLHEKVGGTVYGTLLYISADGEKLGSQRKIMPTQAERLVWGQGDGSDINVYETPVGRVGGLNCFEHQMAPARIALSSLNVEVHAAAWPGHDFLTPIIDASMRHLAHENACFVVVAREFMSEKDIPSRLPVTPSATSHWNTHGGSAIIAPGGKYIVEPIFGKETIVHAEINLSDIAVNKWFIDGVGHYSRPDIFQLKWDRRKKPPVQIRE